MWGLSLFVALVVLMGFGRATPWVPLALALGIVADAEGLAISMVLPAWTHDVKSVWHAWRIRAAWLAARRSEHGAPPFREPPAS